MLKHRGFGCLQMDGSASSLGSVDFQSSWKETQKFMFKSIRQFIDEVFCGYEVG